MSVLKRCGAVDHLAMGHNERRGLPGRAVRADKTDRANKINPANKTYPLEIELARSRTERSAFHEDFVLEHSLSGLRITAMDTIGSF